jgi:pyruvate dehydrogenase E1 component alpha subunit
MADLRQVWRLRAFEEIVLELRLDQSVVGSVHLDIGQEAVPTGAVDALGPDDAVFATYRGHGWALACGVPPEALFAELLGRRTGVNGGRGGSAYLTAPEYRFFGENSIVGAGAPIALGAALAGRYDGSNRVALTVFGDGAMNQGAVHEALNFAAALNLPVVFLCENNLWSEMTPISAAVREPHLYRRAAGYGIPGERIDGSDPSIVREKVRDAFDMAREGGGPTLIECMTTRLVGHYIGDVEHYRPPTDLARAKEGEPVALLRQRIGAGAAPSVLEAMEQEARTEMAEAAATALSAPLADGKTSRDHVYV